mmetsp:Transcript_4577/g.16401  ORF Transcript_4577/g.16401 Transcript_4577/m.16401 type:complete len:241 (+) Transcript_4577:1821-2543(+)
MLCTRRITHSNRHGFQPSACPWGQVRTTIQGILFLRMRVLRLAGPCRTMHAPPTVCSHLDGTVTIAVRRGGVDTVYMILYNSTTTAVTLSVVPRLSASLTNACASTAASSDEDVLWPFIFSSPCSRHTHSATCSSVMTSNTPSHANMRIASSLPTMCVSDTCGCATTSFLSSWSPNALLTASTAMTRDRMTNPPAASMRSCSLATVGLWSNDSRLTSGTQLWSLLEPRQRTALASPAFAA